MVLSWPSTQGAETIETGPSYQEISNEHLQLTAATQFGPRITSLSYPGAESVFADLGDLAIDLADGGRYTLRGGHRLWAAPEIPEITYEPDDDPVVISPIAAGLIATGPETTEIGKSITVVLKGSTVEVSHVLTNQTAATIDVAPWAITQLVPGGAAIMPLPLADADPHGLLPNSSLVLWPYTGVDDSPFAIRHRLVVLDTRRATATKVGTPLQRGWLAYIVDGTVFVKRATHQQDGRYLDLAASGQIYAGPDFVELETLGEQVLLHPGEATTHRETWELHQVDPGMSPYEIPDLLDLDGGSAP